MNENWMNEDWVFDHFEIATEDMDNTVKTLEACGIGPFESEQMIDTSKFPEYEVFGKAPVRPILTKIRTAQVSPNSPVKVKVVQPFKEESIHTHFLAKHGPGIEHICYIVQDLEADTARLVEKGFPIILSGVNPWGSSYKYFDTLNGFYLELIMRPKQGS